MYVSPLLSTFGLQISIMNFILGRTIVRISRDHGHLSNLLKSLPLIFVEFYQLSLPRVWVGTGALEELRTGSGAAGAWCAEEPGSPPLAGPN